MHECGKATLRRLYHGSLYARAFAGHGIDIGAGYDPLGVYQYAWPAMLSVRSWDLEDGDAQLMAGVEDAAYDFVHSSHCLEHVRDPHEALTHWVRITKPGGYLVLTFPDEDLYEQGVWPSSYNDDHKHTFTISKPASWCADSINVTALIDRIAPTAECVSLLRLDATYDPHAGRTDQTKSVAGECAIELVLRRRRPAEPLG